MSIEFPETTLDFQTAIACSQVDKTQNVGSHFLKWIVRHILVIRILVFENKESPFICYEYNKPIRRTIFN